MNRFFRSPSRIAIGYVALSVAALALFALPLWHGWHTNYSTFRAYVDGKEMQRLVDLFSREGAQGLAAALESQAGKLQDGEIVLLADPSKVRLAGNLPAWPSQMPDAPGMYGLGIDVGGGTTMRFVGSHTVLPGGYHLMVGRESARFDSLIGIFWYGIAGVVAIVLLLGAGIGWLSRRALNAEQALRRAHEELEATVVQRTTQLECANAALKGSEERYVRAMEASEAGHWDWDLLADTVFHSPRIRELNGIAPDRTYSRRSEWLALQPLLPGELERQERAIRAAIADPAMGFRIDVRVAPRPGELRWIRTQGKVFRDEAGRPLRMVGTQIDVTDQKLAQEALRLSEQRYALAMEAAGDGHTDWIIATDQFYASPRTLEICGMPPGTTFSGRAEWVERFPFHPDDRLPWERAVNAHLASGSGRFEMEVRILPGGEQRWIKLSAMCSRDPAGKAVRWSGSITDVTDRKQAESALRDSEERFALAVAGSSDGIWDWDILTNEMFISERAQRIYGLEPGVTVRARSEWRAMVKIHPDDVNEQRNQVENYLAGNQPSYEGEWRVQHADGSYRWIRIRGQCVRDGSGRATRMSGSVSDIDKQKQAEAALRESEERFALAVAGSNSGIFDWNLVSDRMFMSDRAQRFFGVEPGSPIRARKEWMALTTMPAEDVEHARLALIAHLRGETHDLDVEYRLPQHDGGGFRWFRMWGTGLRDSSGRVYRMAGSLEDITDRKLAAEALRESEARFRSLTEISSDWYWRQDENFRFTYFSGDVNDRAGYSTEPSLGRTRWELPITPLTCTWEEHRAVLEARQPFRDFEFSYIDPTGKTHYVNVAGAPLVDDRGHFTGYVGVARNVTDRRRIEEDLRARTEMLDLAQKAAHAVAFDWRIEAGDGENRWSPELEAMYGLTPGGYDGTFKGWKKLVHPDDWPGVRDAVQYANETGDVAAEYRVVHPGGVVRWLQAKGKMLFDAGGKPVRMVGFMLDVTDRHEAEDELRRLEKQLRQAQRLEAMGTLAGGIAHDFNNILGAILGYGEMALRDAPEGGRLRRDLDSITAAGERGRALVERILAFSRSGVGERIAVNVEKVVRESIDLLTASLPPGITLKAELRAGRAAMQGDPTQVHQVVMNLATNSIQAMASGGILRISLHELTLHTPRVATTGTLAAGDYVTLKVADSGTGIPGKILDRIFDPFFTTKEVGVGTGLGLSLVHGIVTEVGGAIDVATIPGEGSIFTVYLPRSGEASEGLNGETPALPRGEGQRVLVVDDEEPLVRLASETLEDLGYAPVGFTSSTAALDAFRADPKSFDAVITDERMPKLSGSSLIREMRGIRRKIPILLVSGYLGGSVANRAYNAGADEVLKKPLLARDLATSLARVLHP